MKKNRKLFILIMIFIMTGCTAEYNLTINNDTFNESINILVDNDDTSSYDRLNEEDFYISSTTTNDLLYKKEVTEEEGEITKFNYSNTFSYNEFRGTLNSKCFDTLKFEENDGIYSLYAKNFNCLGEHEEAADSYKINIITSNNVLSNNADEVNKNVYTWNINKDNYEKKNIVFQYAKNDIKVPTSKKVMPIIISIIILIVAIISLNFYKRIRENN